ncbi:hypothetical protein [Actinokineospora sp. HUAS TT18]|uniref:DUF2017 family protein n=1 Tax=Actinokineospora sp. HUAS TT18 TaxID=3447451 RepID=UPI003F527C70
MSENVAAALAHQADRLIRFLEAGEIDRRRTGLLRRPLSYTDVERRVFPDAYRTRAEADGFRERHASALRDSAAAHRVRAWLTQTTDYVLPTDAVDDWLITFGLARFLTASRTGAGADLTFTWLNHVQNTLVHAMWPH